MARSLTFEFYDIDIPQGFFVLILILIHSLQIPNVVFMNKAIEGEEQLRRTTLAQLGAVAGSALMKYSCKTAPVAASNSAVGQAPPSVEPPADALTVPAEHKAPEEIIPAPTVSTSTAGSDQVDGSGDAARSETAEQSLTASEETNPAAFDSSGQSGDVVGGGSIGGGDIPTDAGERPWTVGKPRSSISYHLCLSLSPPLVSPPLVSHRPPCPFPC